MAQGTLILGMPSEEYHAHPAISKSCLDQMARSPFHYHAKYIAEDRPQDDDATGAQKLGSLAHCAILEPEQIEKRYIVRPDDLDMRTKAGKEWAAGVQPGLEVISADQLKAAQSMRWSLLRLPDVESALSCGIAEASIFMIDETNELELKIRPDWIHECDDGGVILLDLKTCTDASPREFGRSCAKWRYHVQAAFYTDVYTRAFNRKVHGFAFAVVESAYPYAPACYMLDEVAMRKGRQLYMSDLAMLRICRQSNVWTAYGENMQLLQLPAWAVYEGTTL